MALVRKIARPLLASIFVYGGIDTLRNPDAKVPAAEKVVSELPPKLPMIGTTKQLVQADAAVKVVAGLLLATGRVPRLSALALAASVVPTTVAGHRYWEETDPVKRKAQQTQFLKNASILGGVLLAAVDTHGKPSVAWRARQAAANVRDATADSASNATATVSGAATAVSDRIAESAHSLSERAGHLLPA